MGVGVVPINQVIGSHDSTRLSLLNSNLKWLEVDLAQCPLADLLINSKTLRLLLIGCEMLNRGRHTDGLEALDALSGELSSEQRVLRETFKVTATEGVAMVTHGRAQEAAGTLGLGLLA
jgi:hypothetical protein